MRSSDDYSQPHRQAAGSSTRLHNASMRGGVGIMHNLIRQGESAEALDEKGRTALLVAVLNCNHTGVRGLAEAGANLEARDHDGYTGLHIAAARGDEHMVVELLAHGADKLARTPHNETAEDLCRSGTHYRLAELIRDYTESRGRDR